MAAPTKCTPELTEEIVQILRAGNYIEVACDYVGISERTYHYWMKRARDEIQSVEDGTRKKIRKGEEPFVAFFQATTRARRGAEIQSVARIRKAGEEDWKADAWFLEHSMPDRWGRRNMKIEHTGANDGPIKIATGPDFSALSDDELETMERLLEKANSDD